MKLYHYEQGVSLIEVLVSLILLAIAILGFAALQTQAVSATSESAVRVNALNVIRDLGDSVRYNITQKQLYEDTLNDFTDGFKTKTLAQIKAAEPGEDCGLNDSDNQCDRAQQTAIEAYKAAKIAYDNGFDLRMQDCPGTDGRVKCLIAAWDGTNAKIGTGGDDCMDDDGGYKADSRCMVMEML